MLEPRPELEPPASFAVSVRGHFEASGLDLFEAYTPLGGDTTPVYLGGFRCAALDPLAATVLQEMLSGRGEPAISPALKKPGYVGVLLVSATAGRAGTFAQKCVPESGECCIFVDCSDGQGRERCEVILGERVRAALDSLLADPGRSANAPRIGPLLSELLTSTGNGLAEKLRVDGRLTAITLSETLPLFGYGLAFYEVLLLVRDLLPRLPQPGQALPYRANAEALLQGPLDLWIPRLLNQQDQDRYANDDGRGDRSAVVDLERGMFSLANQARAGVDALFQPIQQAYATLPDAAWAFGLLCDEIVSRLAQSRILEQAEANNVFQASLLSTVLSMQGLGQVVTDNARFAQAHQQQIRDLAIGGSVVGGTAFALGTVYGVIYDIVDMFVQLIRYSFAGIRWMFYQGKAALDAALADDPCPPASDETVANWFPIFDLDRFFAEELPELYESAKALSDAIRDDFIANAAHYGEMVGQYLVSALGHSLEGTLALVFDPYDASAGYLKRIWYVVEQWFYLGSVLGPIIVDIVLTFCTAGGEGVVAVAMKLGKLDKLKDVFRVNKVGTEVVEAFTLFKRIVALFPDELARLAKVVSRVIEKVWDAIGPIRDQLIKVLQNLQKQFKDVDLDWWAAQIDQMYDRASSINFLVGLFLLVTGNAAVDAEGATQEAPA